MCELRTAVGCIAWVLPAPQATLSRPTTRARAQTGRLATGLTADAVDLFVEKTPASAFCSRTIMAADANAAVRDEDLNATLHTVYRSFGDVRTTEELIRLHR